VKKVINRLPSFFVALIFELDSPLIGVGIMGEGRLESGKPKDRKK